MIEIVRGITLNKLFEYLEGNLGQARILGRKAQRPAKALVKQILVIIAKTAHIY